MVKLSITRFLRSFKATSQIFQGNPAPNLTLPLKDHKKLFAFNKMLAGGFLDQKEQM